MVPRAPSLELYVLPSGGGQFCCRQPNGAEWDRTPDLCSAIAALSQLSYSPAPGSTGRLEVCLARRPRHSGAARSQETYPEGGRSQAYHASNEH